VNAGRPASVTAVADFGTPTRREIDVLAARTLALFATVGVAGGMVAVLMFGGIGTTVRATMLAILAVMLMALLALHRYTSRERPRAVVFATLAIGLFVNAALAWVMGVGVHGASMGLMALLITLAGVLIGVRYAVLLAVAGTATVLVLYVAELRGWIGGAATAAALPAVNRVYTLIAMMGIGLVCAAVLSRMYLRTLDLAASRGQRLAALLRVGADWVWEEDAQHRITYLTEAFARRCGVPLREFIGRAWWEVPGLIGPDVGWDTIRRLFESGLGLTEHLMHTRDPQGHRIVLRLDLKPRHDEEGRLVGWLGVGRDVTRQVEAEQRHSEMQQMLEALFRTSSDAILLVHLGDGRIVTGNEALARMLGHPIDDMVGRTPDEVGLWDDPAERERLRAAVQRDHGIAGESARVRRSDGSSLPVTVSASRFVHEGRAYAIATIRDQTQPERDRLAAAIVFEHAAVGIALVRDATFVRVNRRFEELLGQEPGSLAGRPTRILFADDQAAAQMLEESRRALEHGRYERQLDAERPDGTHFIARVRAQPVDPARPLEAGSVWLLEDVTEREAAQAALTRALGEAEAASRAKSAFLATMSHEIRTPLNGTLGMIRLALDTPREDPRREEFLQHAAASAATLAGIIGDVLDLSRIEAGKLQLESAAFDLRELLHTIERAQRPLAEARGLTFTLKVDRALQPRRRGDELRLRQMIVNLVGNALKFTERGRIEVRASALPGGELRLEVEDTGVGIPLDVQARLFRPFVQADATTTRRYGGSGLGLSICRELATLMGGRIGVHSQPGEGSLFWIEVPLAVVRDDEGADAPRDATQPLTGLRVMVVEDNPVNMMIAVETLRRWGAEAIEAADGTEAVQHLGDPQHGCHVVLMDMHMPTMNGAQATQALRAMPHNRRLPIVALTAAALSSEQQQALEAGMDDFVAKPIDPQVLLAVLQRMVTRPRAA
jgi:PAS domain S-box-containing protein